jgi:hypothetical protein
MSIKGLKNLERLYPKGSFIQLQSLASQYDRRRTQEILQVAAIAADVSADSYPAPLEVESTHKT